MTRDEVNNLCVGDIVGFLGFELDCEKTWVVKEIFRNHDDTIYAVKVYPVGGVRIYTITITAVPRRWTLVKKARPDVHPLEQLRQRLDSSK